LVSEVVGKSHDTISKINKVFDSEEWKNFTEFYKKLQFLSQFKFYQESPNNNKISPKAPKTGQNKPLKDAK